MKGLLAKATAGHFKKHPLQAVLAVVGVSLGVAVFVGIEGANASALAAFESSTRAVAGRATHQIIGDTLGVPEDLYRTLRTELGVRWAAPVVEGFVRLGGPQSGDPTLPGDRFRLMGVDPFAESGFRERLDPQSSSFDLGALMTGRGIVLSETTAAELGVETGSSFVIVAGGEAHTVEVVGLFEPRNDFDRQAAADLLLADISNAQTILRLGDRISRIDLVVPAVDSTEDDPLAQVRAALPPEARIVRPEQRSGAAAQMTRAFRLNLRALSLLALLCGAFLIYNTMTFAIVQRRQSLGTLRALGATARELLALVLAEAFVVGAVGSGLGVLLGKALAHRLIGGVTQTINDLYFTVSVTTVTIPGTVLLTALALGVGASVTAAIGPALEALRTRPRAALDRAELESRARVAIPRISALGALGAAGGVGLLLIPQGGLLTSFVALFLVLLGLACLTPATTLGLMALLTPVAGALFGNLGRISARGVVAALSRTAIAIAALMMAVAVTVGVDVMIRSFRGTVDRWLAYSLPADLYVTSPAVLTDRFSAAPPVLDDRSLAELRSLAGVGRVSTVRSVRVDSEFGSIRLLAHDLDEAGTEAFRLKQGDPDEAWPAYLRGDEVLVSEPFSFRHGVEVGDALALITPAGIRSFPVAGVFYDYATEEGTVLLAQPAYSGLFTDRGATAAALYLADDTPGAERESAVARLKAAAEAALGDEFVVRSNGALRAQSLKVFDRTFLVTGVLKLLAVLVAFVGVLAALTALQLERGRELGVLRALGLTPSEVWTLVTSQTGLIGLVAGVLAVPVGLVMSTIMIHVINRRSFGWSLEMAIAPGPLAMAVLLSVGAALLAGLYPAYRMARTSPAEALRGE